MKSRLNFVWTMAGLAVICWAGLSMGCRAAESDLPEELVAEQPLQGIVPVTKAYAGQVFRPAFSPDGTRLALVAQSLNRMESGEVVVGAGDIVVVDLDGGHWKQLTGEPGWDAPADLVRIELEGTPETAQGFIQLAGCKNLELMGTKTGAQAF